MSYEASCFYFCLILTMPKGKYLNVHIQVLP